MKLTKKLMSLAMLFIAGFSVVSCGLGGGGSDPEVDTYTRNIYTSVSPSNWNELTYQDANDTQIMSYINGSFFEYDFKFDESGEIIDGQFEVEYSAATAIEDVTSQYVGEEWGLTSEDSQRAFKVTLRHDLKWDDGTAIDASDFVYTMKEQLNPLFQHYRADSFYNSSCVIHGAKNYAFQGQSGWFSATNAYGCIPEDQEIANSLIFSTQKYQYGEEATSVVTSGLYDTIAGYGYSAYVDAYGMDWLLSALWGAELEIDQLEGKTYAEIQANPTYKAAYDAAVAWWCTEEGEDACFWVCEYTFPEVSFDTVGFFQVSKYEFVFIMDKSIELLDEDGNMTYHCGYDLGSFPLVKESLYEDCKVAPNESSTLWTTTYNSSVATTASWGPYKLTAFQSGKYYKLERNEYWYGYNMEENEGYYQTDAIECETIESWNTAFIKFQAGELDGISIDASVASTYKNSSRAYFTADDYVSSLQLQSDAAALKNREEEGVDKEMLIYQSFRKALSVGLDRDEYCDKTTTASLAGFGLFNTMHYYDVANGAVYRNSEVAKQVLVDVYALDVSSYESIDAAIDSMGGANLEEARKLVDEAYTEAITAGTISATDRVVLTYGTSVDNEATRRAYDYLNNAFQTIMVGTQLEGRFELEFDSSFGDNWAKAFRNGEYDICAGGWSGAAWDPGYFLTAYLDDGYRYALGWNPSQQYLTFTFQGEEHTMSLIDWYNCLNGVEGAAYMWDSTHLSEEERLPLIAALEKEILLTYYTVPVANYFSASLISYKIEYITYDYNTFMGYGGIKYMTYNYSDAEWEAAVAAQGGELDYTK